MDRGTLARLEQELGTGVSTVRSLGGQHGVAHFRLQHSTGRIVFAKVGRPSAGAVADSGRWPGSVGQLSSGPGFAAEASGLRWLADGGAAVPGVLAVAEDFLAIDWIEMSAPEARAASVSEENWPPCMPPGPKRFGAPWPGVIAGLPLPNEAPRRPGLAADGPSGTPRRGCCPMSGWPGTGAR